MRSAIPGVVVLALLGTAAPASAAVAAGTGGPRAEQFVMTFQTFDGLDRPTHVSATGPVQGAGLETQTDVETPDGEVVAFTWHLRGGDVFLVADEDYSMTFDVQACTAKATGTGTWTITGGTGAYAGASGSGGSSGGSGLGPLAATGAGGAVTYGVLSALMITAGGYLVLRVRRDGKLLTFGSGPRD